MSKLISITNTSLDGYVEDETGAFDCVIPDQVHACITELLRSDRHYGRRLHETMAYWDAPVEGYPPDSATSHGSGSRPRRSSFHER